MCAPTPISTTRSRTWSTARSSIPGQCCCGIERIYVHERSTTTSSRASSTLTQGIRARQSARRRRPRSGRWRSARFADLCASRRPRRCARAPRAHVDMKVDERQGRLALSRAGGADQCRPPDGGDARGELRPGRRHHEGARRRRGDRADERQPLRPDRLDLDRATSTRAARDRRPRSRPARSS